MLYGPLVRMAEPLVKWAVEVTRLEDLPRIVRRAAKIATTPPTGPVFISLPGDILNAEAGIELGRATRVDTRVKPSDESLKALAARILKAERPVIVVGDEIVKSDALQEAAQLAETLGCPAYQSSTPYGAHFLSESSCFMGALARIQKLAREALSPLCAEVQWLASLSGEADVLAEDDPEGAQLLRASSHNKLCFSARVRCCRPPCSGCARRHRLAPGGMPDIAPAGARSGSSSGPTVSGQG